MQKLVFLAVLATTILLLSTIPTACYYDVEEELYGNTCDTATIKYSTVVKPLIDSNCSICHAPGGVQSDNPLNTYDALKVYAESGTLVARINDSTSPMPPSGLIDDCLRQKIQAWIAAGALDN